MAAAVRARPEHLRARLGRRPPRAPASRGDAAWPTGRGAEAVGDERWGYGNSGGGRSSRALGVAEKLDVVESLSKQTALPEQLGPRGEVRAVTAELLRDLATVLCAGVERVVLTLGALGAAMCSLS
jgi:hypothetical protein